MDLGLVMGTFGFCMALGVFAFNIVGFRATRRDLAAIHKDIARYNERAVNILDEHGKLLERITRTLDGHGKVLERITRTLERMERSRRERQD